jgi:hypothetical protein
MLKRISLINTIVSIYLFIKLIVSIAHPFRKGINLISLINYPQRFHQVFPIPLNLI